jgi:hypothetical protein
MYMSLAFHLGDRRLVDSQRPGEFPLRETQRPAELFQRDLPKNVVATLRNAAALLRREPVKQLRKALSHLDRPSSRGRSTNLRILPCTQLPTLSPV